MFVLIHNLYKPIHNSMYVENRTTIQISEDIRKELKILASKRDISYQQLLTDMIEVFKELDQNKTIISIPSKLSEKIKNNIKETDMSSVSEYITFLLRMVLSENISLEKSDKKKIKNKLKNLGYL